MIVLTYVHNYSSHIVGIIGYGMDCVVVYASTLLHMRILREAGTNRTLKTSTIGS